MKCCFYSRKVLKKVYLLKVVFILCLQFFVHRVPIHMPSSLGFFQRKRIRFVVYFWQACLEKKTIKGFYELCQSISPVAAPLFGCRTYLPLFRVKRQYRRWAKNLEGGGVGALDRAKPGEKTSRKFLKFSFLKSLQIHQILTTSSYIWRTQLLVLLNSSLNNYLPHHPPPPFPPSYGTGRMRSKSSIEIHKKKNTPL